MNKEQIEVQIRVYLQQLATLLKGQSKALVQDALFDAEDHIRSALTEKGNFAFDKIVDDWGTPQEVASQYIDMESTVQFALYGESSTAQKKSVLQWLLSAFSDVASYRSLIYISLAMPLSLFYAFWLVLGISSAIATVVLIGFPVFLIFMRSVPYLALFEGRLIEFFLKERMPRRPSRLSMKKHQSKVSVITLIKMQVVDLNILRTILYLFALLPLSVVYLTSALIPIIFSISLILSPIIDPLLSMAYPQFSIDINWYWLPLSLPVGLSVLALSFHWIKWVTQKHANLAKHLLIASQE
ncbi:sensor domain-containing protein [Thalassotalea nanhaiensis]|uniref:Sensor domain-containing protein n=1 Tax=Thalassotalea nanhaiensis TaxID=3065648 RepID=A0ABY9TF40_9GAMM|nr:sensor domain-containing protein [Colwelliaceae bacterium SQ345]